jgi:hypothetical protein
MYSRRDLTRLFVKVFGLIILLTAVVGLPAEINAFIVRLVVFNATSPIDTWQALALLGGIHFGPSAVYAAIGLGFLCWSGRIVDRVGFAPEQGEVALSPDMRNIEESLVAVLGLYFFANGVAEMCKSSFSLGLAALGDPPLPPRMLLWSGEIGAAVQAVVKLMIGILLVLGRGGSVALRRRLHAWVRRWRAWPY